MARILIVEDEFGIGDLLRELLRDDNHEVQLVTDGRQGLEKMFETRPDLVLLDFMMPVLDGAGVLQAMRADPALSRVPVILMTSLPKAAVQSRANGYTSYVRKPFRSEQILALVAQTLRKRGGPAG